MLDPKIKGITDFESVFGLIFFWAIFTNPNKISHFNTR